DPLGAGPEVVERSPATRAGAGRPLPMVAAVADQRLAVGVEDERNVAEGADQAVAAILAQHDRRQPAPAEEEERLLPGGDGLVQRFLQAFAEQGLIAPVQFQAEIN